MSHNLLQPIEQTVRSKTWTHLQALTWRGPSRALSTKVNGKSTTITLQKRCLDHRAKWSNRISKRPHCKAPRKDPLIRRAQLTRRQISSIINCKWSSALWIALISSWDLWRFCRTTDGKVRKEATQVVAVRVGVAALRTSQMLPRLQRHQCSRIRLPRLSKLNRLSWQLSQLDSRIGVFHWRLCRSRTSCERASKNWRRSTERLPRAKCCRNLLLRHPPTRPQ